MPALRRSRLGFQGALLLAPFVWVAIELARARITAFPWDLLGIAQVDNPLLLRLAPVTGAYGISFLIAAVNGWAVGGGFGICMLHDVRIASTRARFASGFITAALGPEYGLSVTVPVDGFPPATLVGLTETPESTGAGGRFSTRSTELKL